MKIGYARVSFKSLIYQPQNISLTIYILFDILI